MSCYSANVKLVSRACINPKGILLGWTWFQFTPISSLEKNDNDACNDASLDRDASVCNVKSKAVSLPCCSPSGL